MEELLDSDPVDWAAVQQRIGENPDEIRWKDRSNRTVLHYACSTNAPLDMFVFLLEKNPDAARVKENSNIRLPLHEACHYGRSVAVIQLLVEAYPYSLNVTFYDGITPLQYAKHYGLDDIAEYLESVTESMKTRQSDKRIAAMVMERIAAMVDIKFNEQTNEFSNLTTTFKTDNESKFSTLTTDLDKCNKKIADMEKEVNAIIEKKLSALIAELRTVNQNTKEDLKTCYENIADLEKVVKENITAKVVECIAAMVNNKINEQTNEISNLATELKKNLTAELKTCNKKIGDLEREVKAGDENIVSSLTADLNTGNVITLSTFSAELNTGNDNTLITLGGKRKKSEESIAAIFDKKLNSLKEELKSDNNTMEAEMKFSQWKGIFFCVVAQMIFSNISPFLFAQLNTTSIAIVDDTMFLDRHDGSMMGVLSNTFMMFYRQFLIVMLTGILGFILFIHSKHFIMIYHTFLKQALLTWHKAFDFFIRFLESVKGIFPSQ